MYVVDHGGAEGFGDFVSAFNQGIFELVGGHWNGTTGMPFTTTCRGRKRSSLSWSFANGGAVVHWLQARRQWLSKFSKRIPMCKWPMSSRCLRAQYQPAAFPSPRAGHSVPISKQPTPSPFVKGTGLRPAPYVER